MRVTNFFAALLTSGVMLLGALPNHLKAAGSDSEAATQKAVLITGASSGIGRKTTELLASKGYYVYAGARKPQDLAELDAIDNVQALRLDVTKQDEIDAAVATVRKGGRGLHGLVNNAGVIILAPLIEVDEAELDFQLDVNVYGPYRVTKAFAPLLIESGGRVSNISSLSGILSGPLLGPYSMSKHALEAYSDSLSDELGTLGVKVSTVEPGTYSSEIGKSFCQRMAKRSEIYESSRFKPMMDGFTAAECSADAPANGPEPDAVAEAIAHALFDDHPKARYMVVPVEAQARMTISKAIEEAVSLNQDQPFSYTREQLIEILDAAMAAH